MRLYFDDPRFRLSTLEELAVRLVAYLFYAVATVTAFFALFSDIATFRYTGILTALFLVDRFIHRNRAARSIAELARARSVNLSELLTPQAERLLYTAFRRTLTTRRNFFAVLTRELLREQEAVHALVRAGAPNFDELVEHLETSVHASTTRRTAKTIIADLERFLKDAYTLACQTGAFAIDTPTLLAAVVRVGDNPARRVFDVFGIAPADVQEAAVFGRYHRLLRSFRFLPITLGGLAHRAPQIRRRIMNRAWTARPTPKLDRFGTDLTELARRQKIGLLVGHGREFEQLLDVVSRPGKPNALLVGEPGSGRTALVHHLAFRMVRDDVPPALFDKRLVALEIGSVLASRGSAGEETELLRQIVDEVVAAGNVVLFMPDAHVLFKVSEKSALRPADILLPLVRSNAVPLIGETFPREFKAVVEPNSDFLEQFAVVRVTEISDEEAVRFLVYSAILYERQFRVRVTVRALRRAVQVARRYIADRPLPGSAVDLLKEAFARARREGVKALDAGFVATVAEERLGVPIDVAEGGEAEKLLHLEEIIHRRLVGQDEAVSAVSRSIREYRSGLVRRGGPIATFLFVGPTGVGKTELAKILAETLFGSRTILKRFDMTEYQDRQSIFRLIGNPDGERTGNLTDAVRERPYGVLLLDEFEKAHPDVLNLFLQVFDDGRLTDSVGRTVDFQNTLIVATSNVHSGFVKDEIERGRRSADIASELKRKLTDCFAPELINRFSDIIVFRELLPAEIASVARIFVGDLATLIQAEHGIMLAADDAAIQRISELGYDPVFGARPLRKVISREFRERLSEMLLSRTIGRGDTIAITYVDDRFVFSRSAA